MKEFVQFLVVAAKIIMSKSRALFEEIKAEFSEFHKNYSTVDSDTPKAIACYNDWRNVNCRNRKSETQNQYRPKTVQKISPYKGGKK